MKSEIHEKYLDYKFSKNINKITDKEIIYIYEFMLRLRMVEEAIALEYHPADEMRLPIHFCLGQEAMSGVLSLMIKSDDHLFSHHSEQL